jgi:hypothetical protein
MYEDVKLTKKLMTEAARVTRAGIIVSILLRQSYDLEMAKRGAD